MIEEQYISLETAKMAKEKGFNEHCKYFYEECLDSIDRWECTDGLFPVRVNEFFCPTQSLLARWLRDVHNVSVSAIFLYGTGYVISINSTNSLDEKYDNLHSYFFKTYEEAIEYGLQEVLKLI